jgi:hypothetical protein
VSGNEINDNIGGFNNDGRGGGLYVTDSALVVSDNEIHHNAGTWSGDEGYGGGAFVSGSTATLADNLVAYNAGAYFPGFPSTANGYGGGIAISGTLATLRRNRIEYNDATNGIDMALGAGGGLYALRSQIDGVDNQLLSNRASGGDLGFGGGAYLEETAFTLDRLLAQENTAAQGSIGRGGGLRINRCAPFTLTNAIVAANDASDLGSGIGVTFDSVGRIGHATIADNVAGDSAGLRVDLRSVVTVENTIVASQTVAIMNTDSVDGRVAAKTILFDDNGTDTSNGVAVVDEVMGPAMLRPDYHLAPASGAIDAAPASSALATDVDGDSRPQGTAPDVGADEAPNRSSALCTRYVYQSRGSDTGACSDRDAPCATVQYAVDQASEGDGVCVAGSSLTDAPPMVYAENVIIDKSIRLDGGWTAFCIKIGGFWTCAFDPASCDPPPVTLDAGGSGRPLITQGASYPTIRCLNVTGGAGEPQGGGLHGGSHGVIVARAVFTNNTSASYGGGAYLTGDEALLRNNTFISNATVHGGGALMIATDVTVTLDRNTFVGNQANGYGAVLHTDKAAWLLMTGNLLMENGPKSIVDIYGRNDGQPHARLINNALVDNVGEEAIHVFYETAELLHNTVAHNPDAAIHAGEHGAITATNNLLAYNSIGIAASSGGTVAASHNLLWSNGGDPITGTGAVLGDPDLASDGYHIGTASAALGQATGAGVADDIDGEARVGLADIGADERWPLRYLPLVLRAYAAP